ncbi:hypothetical protein M758_UG291200, partial [Ceratodon purpureus]
MPGVQASHKLGVQRMSAGVHVSGSVLPRISWQYKHMITSCFCLQSQSDYWICLDFAAGCIDGGRRPRPFMTTRSRRHEEQLPPVQRHLHSRR